MARDFKDPQISDELRESFPKIDYVLGRLETSVDDYAEGYSERLGLRDPLAVKMYGDIVGLLC